MITTTVLLSGGLATRLYPMTQSLPKALIDINGKPFIEHQLRLLRRNGITDVVICAGFLGEQIEAIVRDGNDFGIRVRYSYDGDTLLGTGGAVRKALGMLPDEFFVMYGDSYLPVEFAEVARAFEQSDKSALMTVIKNENKWDASNVIFRDGNIVRYDKRNIVPEMTFIDYGLAILTKDCVAQLSEGEVIDIADMYRKLSERGDLMGYEVFERFYEIGSLGGIEETKKYIN